MGNLGSFTRGRLRTHPLLGCKMCIWGVALHEGKPRRMRMWPKGQFGVWGGYSYLLGESPGAGGVGGSPSSLRPIIPVCL